MGVLKLAYGYPYENHHRHRRSDLERARKLAAREGVTVRAQVEQGLRQVIAEKRRARGFCLKRASFKGRGVRPELEGASWERLRELAYERRGG